ARGLPNRCDSAQPGNCGCIHSEQNALIKAGAQLPGKGMFVSASPWVMCAKMIINTNVTRVYYREAYRDPAGLDVLRQAGGEVVHYDRWRDLWRSCEISQPDSVCTILGSTIGTSFNRRTRVIRPFESSSSATDSSTFRVAYTSVISGSRSARSGVIQSQSVTSSACECTTWAPGSRAI